MRNGPVLLFDGVCNFCNSIVNFLIRQDKKGSISYGSLQSEGGQQILHQFHLPAENFESVVYIKNGQSYQKSDAALEIAKDLGGLWKLAVLAKIIPCRVRDALYEWIARNRYKWFGKKDQCMIPSPEVRQRFID
ncbi:thiol-disulfide oxidoreductase DCC family protein [Fictibacillus fluitans]|uniref:Thiol-disulfide oxidoreductase DCC family protein n=1 Tax=Fictibacillus fluitans TaxID=3058422 RepID=A0ABT8HX85_9BACL|nr:thiol-disulfide oxidoreductase DCC family protein [Fictibacillus sp. NE201]MDN4524852.1 thiol-disulfide oxidoreductase DCC family protein [Fictibacillus sp. NE201]